MACTAILVTLLLVPHGARAFVRGVSMVGYPLSWSSGCETVNIYLNGFTEMTPDEVAKSIGAAAAAWGPGQVTCPTGAGGTGSGQPSFQIILQFATGGSPPIPADDGNNIIVFQTTTTGWDNLPGNPPSDALAYASPWKQPSGDILDVDIEINAVPEYMPYPLANLDPGVSLPKNGQMRIDLQTLMTHEFGHFLGLAHTCLGEGDGTQGSDDGDEPTDGGDDQGKPIPTCTSYPDGGDAVQAGAVMWYEIHPEDISKRVLTADDARGLCAIYPPARVAPICAQNSPDDGCGCAVMSGGGGSPMIAGALAALAWAVRIYVGFEMERIETNKSRTTKLGQDSETIGAGAKFTIASDTLARKAVHYRPWIGDRLYAGCAEYGKVVDNNVTEQTIPGSHDIDRIGQLDTRTSELQIEIMSAIREGAPPAAIAGTAKEVAAPRLLALVPRRRHKRHD